MEPGRLHRLDPALSSSEGARVCVQLLVHTIVFHEQSIKCRKLNHRLWESTSRALVGRCGVKISTFMGLRDVYVNPVMLNKC